MSWDQIIEDTRQYNEKRVSLVDAATAIKSRYYEFMKSMERHLLYPNYLDFTVNKFKFVPEKSSVQKGFMFATSKTKFIVPGEYVLNPDAWEVNFLSEIDERIAMIRDNCSPAFFASLGEIQTQEYTEDRLNLTLVVFRSNTNTGANRNMYVNHRSGRWHYMDKSTGKIYLSTNGTALLFREIANGTAIPAVL